MPVLKGSKSYIVPNFINGIDYTSTKIVTSASYWIFASRGVNMVRLNSGDLESSTDAGVTWGNTTAFTNYLNLLSGYIFSNGNVALFTKDNKIYLTNMTFSSIVEKTLYEDDYVTPYVFHTPNNATYPGAYFECEAHMTITDDTDVYVFANYCNSVATEGGRGASAVIVPMTDDFGVTWINSYSFGQNLVYEDDGTALGSDAGTTLGDSGNTNVCRHAHNINYDVTSDKFYMVTGDQNWTYTTPDMDEIGWYEGTYSDITRTITWSKIDFGITIEKTHRLKGTGFFFRVIEGVNYIYWASDANPVTVPDEQGIWRSVLSTFDTPATHELVTPLDTDFVFLDLKLDTNTNTVFSPLVDADTGTLDWLMAVKDFGHGVANIIKLPNTPFFLRLTNPNSKGFYRLDTEGFNPQQTNSFLIKIGDDLFKNI
jgi:hypothetical protein